MTDQVFDFRARALLLLVAADFDPAQDVNLDLEHQLDCPALRSHRCTCIPKIEATIRGARWTCDAYGNVTREPLH